MTTSTIQHNKAKKIILSIAVILFWITAWHIASIWIVNETILPSPLDVCKRLLVLGTEAEFWQITALSCVRIIVGFFIGCILGTILGIVTRLFVAAKYLLSPILTLIKATPVASFIILLFIWLSGAVIPSFIGMLIVIPVVCQNVYEALASVDESLLEAAQVYQLTKVQKIQFIYIPALRTYFLAAVKTSLGLSFKAGIAAEILCTPKFSIGKEIYGAKIYLNTVDVFAWTAVVIILSLIFELAFVKLLNKVTSRRGANI